MPCGEADAFVGQRSDASVRRMARPQLSAFGMLKSSEGNWCQNWVVMQARSAAFTTLAVLPLALEAYIGRPAFVQGRRTGAT